MNFKDILEKYRNNSATEEERKLVEQEIEKTRLIHEYLVEIDDSDLGLESHFEEEDPKDIKKLNSKITRNRSKVTITSAAIAVFMIIVLQTLLVPLLNSMFYNPKANNYELFRDDLTIQLDAFSRLHFPDYYTNGVMVENTGIGKYAFTAIQGNKFRRGNQLHFQDDFITGTINKNRMEFDYNFFTKFPPINSFSLYKSPNNLSDLRAIEQQQLETIRKIQDLPPHIYLSAYITFEKDLSMEEFSEIYKEFYERNLFINWVGVREIDGPGHRGPLIGFAPPGAEPWFQELETEYPYFNISTYASRNHGNVEPEVFEKHFKELLQFQLDNISFLNMIKNNIVYNSFQWYYKSILDYVNENGVYTYGIKVQGDPESILLLTKHEAFEYIVIDDISVRLP